MEYYHSQAEIDDVVRGFESCALAKDDFGHPRHLTVATVYLLEADLKTAKSRLARGLFRFLDHHKLSRDVYSETITRFWIVMISDVLGQLHREPALVEKVNRVVAELADSQLVYEYYSRELLASKNAKTGWVEPDLRPLNQPQKLGGQFTD